MKFTIDTEKIKKKGIPKEVFFHTLNLYFKNNLNEEVAKEANHLGYNIKTPHEYLISKEGVELVQNVFVDSVNASNKEDLEYEEIAEALVEIFPKGFKAGTKALWRGSISEIAQRLKLLEYKSHTIVSKDKAIKAAIEYVKSFEDLQFMQTLPYFIFKVTKNMEGDIEWASNFLSIVENMKK